MTQLSDLINFNDKNLENRCLKGKIPMETFYEAYFSNFIEGTDFAVREAEEIVFEGKFPA